jgi:hypothetical protein
MNKQILIFKTPECVLNILNGNATLDLNKTVPKGFKGWVNIYVTKGKSYPVIYDNKMGGYVVVDGKPETILLKYREVMQLLNGKIVARFWFDEYSKFNYNHDEDGYLERYDYGIIYDEISNYLSKLCLTKLQAEEYGKGKDLYAWHIKKLEIFDEPKELSEFTVFQEKNNPFGTNGIHGKVCFFKPLTKAPKSWQYVWVKE